MKRLLNILIGVTFAAPSAFADPLYSEPFRPQFHFTPAKNWMNDPNGMVYYDGEYHLFYQYNPFGDKWGHMSWGHAVSKDLVRWEHLPLALAEENKVMIFSGSAVVDWNNTSGFGKDGEPPMIAIYTGHHTDQKRQDQRIAYSNDRGRTWTKWEGNPVLDIRKADFRDPKVMWHEDSKQWVMTVSHPIDRQVGFYASPDLKHWRPLSSFGPAGSTTGIWECPDLFPLGDKWVLIVNVGGGAPAGGSGCQYFVGEFDGRSFTADPETHPDLAPKVTAVPPGKVFADFENGYGDWVATGDAFGKEPATSALDGQQKVDGFQGKAFVNSFHNRDKGTGTLTSPEFEIVSDFINFMIGGGAHENRTCLNLRLGDKIVRTATGAETERPGWSSWDVRELRGKSATLQIVDAETGGWGHVNIDHIMFSDSAAVPTETGALWADYGRDFYAAVSWSDIRKEDGRRIWLGWMSNWQYAQDVPTSPWRSAMTVPRALGLKKMAKGYRLTQTPVHELGKLQTKSEILPPGTVAGISSSLKNLGRFQLVDAELAFSKVADDADFGVRVLAAGEAVVEIRYRGGELSLDRTKSGRTDFHKAFPGVHTAPCVVGEDGTLRLRILLDTSSIEVFAADGTSVLSDLIFPASGGYLLELFSARGTTEPEIHIANHHVLQPAW